jgi:hypothetical protein
MEEDVKGPGAAHDGGDVAVQRTGSGAAFYQPAEVAAPRALARLSRDGQEVVADLQRVAIAARQAQEHVGEHVALARSVGASWDLIGWSVGTTGEAARQRWGGDGR